MNASKRAFSLVEVIIVIGIIAMAILPLVGLISLGQKYTRSSVEELEATNLLIMVIQDLKNSPIHAAKSKILGLSPTPWTANPSKTKETRVWIDSCFNLSETPPPIWAIEVDIDYIKVPNPGDLGTTEALITLRWPKKRRELTENEKNKKENKIATKAVFLKTLSP